MLAQMSDKPIDEVEGTVFIRSTGIWNSRVDHERPSKIGSVRVFYAGRGLDWERA